MRFVALVSGGKDSIYSALECIRNGHELVACVHLGRPADLQEESYMYQTAASEVVRILVEDCLQVPLLLHQRTGMSVNTSLVYEGQEGTTRDEVEDLFLALKKAKDRFDNVQAISSGAILSTYQRVRIENVCSRLGLTSLSYLWRLAPQKELLQKMLQDGIEAVIVRAACPPGLMPQKHLNKTLRFLWDIGLLERLNKRYQFHVCGEGGEYESLVIDSPLHQKKLVLDRVEIDEADDGVGDLRILACHAEDKTENDISIIWSPTDGITAKEAKDNQPEGDPKPTAALASKATVARDMKFLPHIRHSTGGLFHVSEIMATMPCSCSNASEAELAVDEALDIFATLNKTLERQGCNAKDVLFVHLYLSEISHFAIINAHYQALFGTVLPPSRSCVAVGKGVLPGGRRVLLDCMVQPGSGEYMRTTNQNQKITNAYAFAAHATKTSKLREVLHVQSISHWAPVCVGPYSQVNTLRSGLHFMAGQIGLVPASMEIHPTWQLQLDQCWKNVAAVLDALEGGSLKEHLVSGLIYVSHSVYNEVGCLGSIDSCSQKMIRVNGNLAAGHIDALLANDGELYGGYEDEDTWEQMKSQEQKVNGDEHGNSCPILVLSIPEMPKGASVEVEVIAATKVAANNLQIINAHSTTRLAESSAVSTSAGWDTGHSYPISPMNDAKSIRIQSAVRVLGHQSAALALVYAVVPLGENDKYVNPYYLLFDMLSALTRVLAEGRAGLVSKDAIHLRLFHTATKISPSGDIEASQDGIHLRSAFQSAVARWTDKSTALPATSVVPVHAIDVLNSGSYAAEDEKIQFALQALVVDPVHLETDIWIHKDSDYSV